METRDAPLFTATTEATADGSVITLAGECDLSTVAELERALGEASALPGNVVLDLSDLSFLDSACLHNIIEANQRFGEGRLSLRGAQPQVMRVFEIAGLPAILKFDP